MYDDKVIEAIAKKAVELKVGARSLKSITEDALAVANYHVTSSGANNYSELIITPETVENPYKYILR